MIAAPDMSDAGAPGRLGPYELTSAIGAGGMGNVYRARDTRLDRTVAIKILKEAFSHRFEREARAISALHHPHICTLYDIGRHGDTPYLVMEYVQGKPLAGPLSVHETLEYGAQIADAMTAAHRAGVIHRDLKPGNILIDRSGVKVLDFGLASVESPMAPAGVGPTGPATVDGAILGTLRYMAPEQLEGREADARSDVFALGLTLYEMLTGHSAYDAPSAAGVISDIMRAPIPSARSYRPDVPPALDRVIAKCLDKDPDRRWQSMETLREALRWLAESPAGESLAAAPLARARRDWVVPVGLATLAALLVIGWSVTRGPSKVAPNARMVTDLDLPSSLGPAFDTVFVIAPDGRRVVFNAQRALWLRSLEDGSLKRLAGTAGGVLPFWSPDSTAIAFFADGRLQRLTLPDGAPAVLAPAPNPRGGAWGRGTIVFAPNAAGPLLRIPEGGGATAVATVLDASHQETGHESPSFLPDGDRFVFFGLSRVERLSRVRLGRASRPGDAAPPIADHPFDGGAAVVASPEGSFALHVREGELVAQAFDIGGGVVSGPVRTLTRRTRGMFSVSASGAIVYTADPERRNQPVWVTRSGEVTGSAGETGSYQDLAISRDETKVAYARSIESGGVVGLWVQDLATGAATRLPIDGAVDDPVWSPDGRRLVVSRPSGDGERSDVFFVDLDRADQPRRLAAPGQDRWPLDWSRDGRLVLYGQVAADTKYDLWMAPADGGAAPTAIVEGPGKDHGARFSPDGAYIAYQSDETGQTRVYLRGASPSDRNTVLVSDGGGNSPRWRGDGRELYYISPTRDLMAVSIEYGPAGPVPGKPRRLFTAAGRCEPLASGERFLMLRDEPQESITPVHVLTGWQRELM